MKRRAEPLVVMHTSDTHGRFPDMEMSLDVEAIIHTGDLQPNRAWGDAAVDSVFQPLWCAEKEGVFDLWRNGRPVLFCAGNHDFNIPRWDGLIDCTNKRVVFKDIQFYGFPWCPAYGTWNWNAEPGELEERFLPVWKMIKDGAIDVLLAHCPPWGILDTARGTYDRGGVHIGNPALARMLMSLGYTETKSKLDAVLCGHVHESHGVTDDAGGVYVSNAATTHRRLELFQGLPSRLSWRITQGLIQARAERR